MMPIIAKDTGGGDFKIPEQGTHLAICNMVVHLGVQPAKNPAYKPKDTIFVRWELPEERMEWKDKEGVEHEGPMVISNFYTNSLSPKSYLRKDLEGWRAKAFTEEELKGFDVLNILGKPCMLTIVHNESGGKTYANVTSVSALPKSMKAKQAEMKLIKYCADDPEQFDDLPEWLQEKIEKQIIPEQEPDSQANKDWEDDLGDIPF